MASEFLDRLGRQLDLDAKTRVILEFAGVTDYAALFSLVSSFPSTSALGLNLARLSSAASKAMGAAAQTALQFSAAGPPKRPHGVQPPGPVPPVAMPTSQPVRSASAKSGAGLGALNVHLSQWPVKDQGERGTCVAFATAAVLEHQHRSLTGEPICLAEQYLYWATKHHSGDPSDEDGTMLSYACTAVGARGVCVNTLWPYDPVYRGKPVSHDGQGGPTDAAHADACNRKPRGAGVCKQGGLVDAVLDGLRRGSAVALTVPVFRDPSNLALTNWTSFSAEEYGRIIDPPPTAVAQDGHAVCVTGFVPDSNELSGRGYFVFRNSWGTAWAANSRNGSTLSPEPGYGYISARYVDDYGWEVLTF